MSEERPTPYRVTGPRAGRVVGRVEALSRLPWIAGEVWDAAARRFPVRLPRGWMDAAGVGPEDPLLRQAIPSADELRPDRAGLVDPVGEHQLKPHPWLVRKHPDRILLLLTRRCHMYCRYCFRRNDHDGAEDPTPAELDEALDQVRSSGARELILSGGDPLAVRDRKLFDVIDAVRPGVPVVRVHTRAPITAPERVTDALAKGLADRAPVWVLVHANHPDELTPDVASALRRLVSAGVPVLNQAVLLRGINDDADVLARLSERLVELRVFPYYLHHTDHAAGNAAFRVDVERGLEVYRRLARRVSGIGLPRYVVDPPDGSGKIDVVQAVRDGILTPRS